MAALAEAVLVVEAQAGSGALVTARLATARRALLAVPGSAGYDALIASGRARPVCDGARVADRPSRAKRGKPPPVPPALLPLFERWPGARSAVEVARRLSLSLPAALAAPVRG